MMKYFKNIWLATSLSRKMAIYTAVVVLVMGISAAFNISLMDYALNSFNDILSGNSRCRELQEAFVAEAAAFENYAKDRNRENREAFLDALDETKRCLALLPSNFRVIGELRFARTWNVRNAYEGYSQRRDRILDMDTADSEFVPELYRIYSMQEYLQLYARRLLEVTMADGDEKYQDNIGFYQKMPLFILAVSMLLVVIALKVKQFVENSWAIPIRGLINSAREIAVNHYNGQDVIVENRDEMGALVQAFNKMKHASKGYIESLMDNYEMSERLHKEEMERVQTEKALEYTRLELLKSQINPHFLFNTLNTISCMAKLEDADTTGSMITSMSNLFRYNLKTTEQIVPLSQELKVAEDYIYIQKMRFGERIRYRKDIRVDADDVMIPSFTLQPLAENAYIHGLSKKEEGGAIVIRSWIADGRLVVSVADTGVGISEDGLANLNEALKGADTAKAGIGLGNINKRLSYLYPDSCFSVYSRKGRGTVIRIEIPQHPKEGPESPAV